MVETEKALLALADWVLNTHAGEQWYDHELDEWRNYDELPEIVWAYKAAGIK